MKEEQTNPLTFTLVDQNTELSCLACHQSLHYKLLWVVVDHRAEIGCWNGLVINYSFTT